MDNTLILSTLLALCLAVGVANAVGVTPLLQPNSTASDGSYYYENIQNLTVYFSYTDHLLGIIQDWNATIIYNNASSPVANVSMPQSFVRWSMDYSDPNRAADRSVSGNSIDLLPSPMFKNNVAVYLPFEDHFVSGQTCDWQNYTTDCYNATYDSSYVKPIPGRVGYAMNFTRGHTGINYSKRISAPLEKAYNHTVSVWMKTDSNATDYPKIIYTGNLSGTTPIYFWEVQFYDFKDSGCGAGKSRIWYVAYNTGTNTDVYSECVTVRDGEWHHVAVAAKHSYDDHNTDIYVDGEEVDYMYTQKGGGDPYKYTNITFTIGKEIFKSEDWYYGTYDEFYVFNKTLTAQEVLDLSRVAPCHSGYCYNLRNASNEYLSAPNHVNITFGNYNFSVSAWVYLPVAYQTSNEHKIVSKGWAGANAWGLTHDGREARFRMSDGAATTYSATCFNCLSPQEWHHVVGVWNGSGIRVYVDGERGPVEVTKTGLTMSTTSSLDIGSSGVTAFVGQVDDVTLYRQALTDEEVQFIYEDSVYTYGLDNGTYHVEMYWTDYAGIVSSNTSNFTNLTYSRLNISLYDEVNGSRIYNDVTLNLVGGEEYDVTFNGESYMLEVLADTYDTIYSAKPQYAERYAVITANATTKVQQVELYLGNSSTNVYATVYNEENDLVEEATVYVYRRVGGDWVITESSATNIDGVALLHLILDTELYKFVVEYEGIMVYSSEPSYIYSTEITFQISTGKESFEEYFTTESIIANVYFDHSNDRFVYNYIYDGASSTGCLRTYTVSAATGDTLLNETCIAATSAIIYHPVTAINGTTYRSDGFLDWGYDEQSLDSAMYTFPSLQPFKADGIVYQGLATTAVAFTSFWSVTFAVVTVPASLILGKFIGLHDLQWYVLIALQVCSLIIIVIMRRAI